MAFSTKDREFLPWREGFPCLAKTPSVAKSSLRGIARVAHRKNNFAPPNKSAKEKKSPGMFQWRSCAVFWILGEEIADFLTWWILEKTRKWRPKDDGVVVGRAEFSQVSCVLRVCQLCKCSCSDEIRLVMAEAPVDRIQEYQAR
ncbi:hypothetical protein Bbelb_023280 [Branchiostoma belcheri]|nr:hypothetical protein Bbelb_023280 [Branchiostoma belcheri]